jgi:thiol-disulfide isomerase/thioredoxin
MTLILKHILLITFVITAFCGCSQTNKNNLIKNTEDKMNQANEKTYGIEGQSAPNWNVPIWIDVNGEKTNEVKLSDYKGKFKVVYCFQSWCPGCHSVGLPSLKKMVDALKDNNKVAFVAIQTVFEGKNANTFEKLKETQKKYELKIPFGQDNGNNATNGISAIMYNYHTGGTPWFIFIDENDNVIFNDFHVNTEGAINFLKTIK